MSALGRLLPVRQRQLWVESGHCEFPILRYSKPMTKHSALLALVALTSCGLKSNVIDEAAMGVTFECVPLAKQQAALATVQTSLGGSDRLKIRCDNSDCSKAFAEAAAFGGKITLVAIPGSLAVSWFNNHHQPSEQQEADFKATIQSIADCKLIHRHGW